MPNHPPIFTPEEWQGLMEHLALPPRQRETLDGLIQGLSDKQIAEELGIAVPTVRSYLQRMYAKYSVQDRTELVVHVFREFRMIASSNQ